MYKLSGSSLSAVEPLFAAYTNNIPVIFSVIEGQYEGIAYVDSETNPRWALLTTPFSQHFLAGDPLIAEESLEELLFDEVLAGQAEKELVVFSSTPRWQPMLKSIFERRNGLSDDRYILSSCWSAISRLPVRYRQMTSSSGSRRCPRRHALPAKSKALRLLSTDAA